MLSGHEVLHTLGRWSMQDKNWMALGWCRALLSTGGKEPFWLHRGTLALQRVCWKDRND